MRDAAHFLITSDDLHMPSSRRQFSRLRSHDLVPRNFYLASRAYATALPISFPRPVAMPCVVVAARSRRHEEVVSRAQRRRLHTEVVFLTPVDGID